MQRQSVAEQGWVRESRFGRWFLTTDMWFRYVLAIAIDDIDSLLEDRLPRGGTILDAGCGQGQAFTLLETHYHPGCIVGLDIDVELIQVAPTTVNQSRCPVGLTAGDARQMPFPDGHFDAVFCHQLLHHVSDQEAVLREFYRILAPGRLLLVCESCRSFIDTFPVRLLFRHPLDVQKSAEEYIDLVRSIGFELNDQHIKLTTPWWSQRDLGITQKLGLRGNAPLVPTEVAMVAIKA